MFKRIGNAWRSHTPVWLHPRTKENIIAQLIATVLLVGGYIAYQEWQDRRSLRRLEEAIQEKR